MISVKIQKISYHPSSRSYAVLLKETNGKRILPILVGTFEAQSISLALEEIETPRPLTHDLICEIISGVKASISRVIISKLNDGVFYAKLEIKNAQLGLKVIDARPSDALSVAIRLKSKIFVSEDIIEEAGIIFKEEDNLITLKNSLKDLEEELRIAVEKEDYEKAAKLRDEIKSLDS